MNEQILFRAALIIASYFIGGIPFGYLIGRLNRIDVRTVGSKNIGATNVFRTVGKKWGLLAFACDVLKGVLPTLLAVVLDSGVELFVGVACVVGHMLTPYMKFRGGKGVATTFGVLIALSPTLVGCAFLLFSIVFALSNYISLGSCVAAAFLAVMVWFPVLGEKGVDDVPKCILLTAVALFVIWKHRSNIVRLAKGCENKVYLFGSKGR
jgi:glycerol-3-phosphate acyltransferase PlsY